ncbi:MAG TPA: ABC transporter substrate-binding protein [Streptosporangiaceae bacterium]|nr:ABC transporter substrate-binding protein [Streptosporangiaceae bacterium]
MPAELTRRWPAAVSRLLAPVAGVLTLLLATACGSAGPARPPGAGGLEKTHLVIGAVPAVGSAGLYIAQDRGLFARQGLHVTIKPITDPTTTIPAMLHGSMDAVFGQWTSCIAADAAGVAQPRGLQSCPEQPVRCSTDDLASRPGTDADRRN